MPPPRRLWLTALRLALLFAIGCFLVLAAGLLTRTTRDYDQGLRGPLPPADTLSTPYLGVTADITQLSPDRLDHAVAELAAAGFAWVRIRLVWDALQPAPDRWEWTAPDRVLAALVRAGLTPVVVLDGSPSWARAPQDSAGSDGHLAPPTDFADFAAFAAAVAARYGPQLRFYQLWDEPNIAPHWGARHIDPAGYARLLKATAPALRAADPDAVILLAALAPTADRGHTAQDEVFFLQRLYAAGAAPYFDAVAVQPFGFATSPYAVRQRPNLLNFHRAVLVRRAMVAAGDGTTPIWLVRYGWNRAPNSPWGTVPPEHQTDFAVAALAFAYHYWPWAVAQGWADQVPHALPDDPRRGFALTPDLTAALHQWAQSAPARGQALAAPPAPPMALVAGWAALAGSFGLWLWRVWANLRALPWIAWRARYRRLAPWQQGVLWALLLIIYYVATWPPLIVLCWVLAALGIAAQPVTGPALALALLPFHAQNKELHWVNTVWAVPPAQAALLCTLPALWLYRRRWQAPLTAAPWPWWALAGGWLMVALLGATGVWYWPGYAEGMLNLVLVPLALFALLLGWAPARSHIDLLSAALFAGGVLMAVAGLAGWLAGGGTDADGLRRLVGPTFSPNHTALYLERSLFLGLGLALAHPRLRPTWLACALVAVALLLTGSRGAILLGMPLGLAVLFLLRWDAQPWGRRLRGRLGPAVTVSLGGLALLVVWGLGPRLTNSATVHERFAIWWLTLSLWRDAWLFGIGPGGFYWRFPAYLPVDSLLDPNLRHPHIVWLEFAAQGGLAGVLWLAGALVVVGRWLRAESRRLAWPQIGLVAALAAALAHGQVDAFQALPDLAAWNWSALALLLVWPRKPPIKKPLPLKAAASIGPCSGRPVTPD